MVEGHAAPPKATPARPGRFAVAAGVAALALALALVAPVAFGAPPTEDEIYRRGDEAFAKKSFNAALGAFDQLLTEFPGSDRREEATFKAAFAQERLGQTYEAARRVEAALGKARPGEWRARLQWLAGRLHLDHWQLSAPVVQAGLEDAFRWFEAAAKGGKHRDDAFALAFDYARLLNERGHYDVDWDRFRKERPDGKDEDYWSWRNAAVKREDDRRRERIRALYGFVIEQDGGGGHPAALARYHLACFYFHAYGRLAGIQYYRAEPAEGDAPRPKPEPPSAEEVEARKHLAEAVARGFKVVDELVEKRPDDPLAPEALYLAALARHQYIEDLPGAVKSYRRLAERYPKHDRAQDARGAIVEILREEVSVRVDGPVVPGEKTVVQLGARNVKKVTLRAYRVRPVFSADPDGPSAAETTARNPVSGEPAATLVVETGLGVDHRGVTKPVTIAIPDALGGKAGPGAYVLVARGDAAEARALVLVSNLAVAVHQAADRALVYCADAKTGAPRADADVEIRVPYYDGNRRVVFRKGRTDARGLASIPYGVAPNGYIETVARAGDEWAIASSWAPGRDAGEQLVLHASADRPVYRPGNTVNLKAILRRAARAEFASRYENVPGARLRVLVTDPRGEKVFEKELKTTDLGTASASFTLGEEPPLGVYGVAFDHEGSPIYAVDWASSRFRVEEYKKPEYEVTVAFEGARHKPGEPIEARIQGRYYFGAAVAEADVRWQVFRTQHFTYWWPREEYDWLIERDHPGRHGYGGRELIAEGSAKTDAAGIATVRVPTKPYEEVGDSRYSVEVRVTDRSRREIEGSGSVTVTRDPFDVYVVNERGVLRPGEKARLALRTQDADGRPVAAKGEVRVIQRTYGGRDEKTGEVRFDDRELGRDPAATGEDGNGKYDFVVDVAGLYIFRFVVPAEGRELAGEAGVWVADSTWRGGENRFANLDVVPDKASYKPGEAARLLVQSPFAGAHVLLVAAAAGSIYFETVVSLEGTVATVELPIDGRHAPNVFVRATLLRDRRAYHDAVEIAVPPTDRFLDVRVKYPKAEFRPGERTRVRVETFDLDGRPVAAEVAVGVVDASIYSIAPDRTADVRRFFYGTKRHLQVNETNGLGFSAGGNGIVEPDVPGPRRSPHALPDHCQPWSFRYESNRYFGSVEDRASPEAQTAAPATGEASPAPPAEGARARDESEKKAAKEEAANGGSGPEEPEVQVRKSFPDAVLWAAHVRTDASGKAEVEVAFPDSLTTWRTTARAVTADTRVGEVKADVITTKDLLVRLQAPRFFTERDEVVLSAIVHNKTKGALPVKVDLALEGGTIEMLSTERSRREVEIAAAGEVRVDWRVRALKAGKAVVRMTARAPGDADAVEMSFPVLAHGAEMFIGRMGSMVGKGTDLAGDEKVELAFTIPAEHAPGSPHLRLVLSSSVATVVLESLPYLVEYPYGCVEQTMSRFLPAVVARRTLSDLKLDLAALAAPPSGVALASTYDAPHRRKLKAVDERELEKIVAAGLARLYAFQHGDGGFGWWQGGESDPYMTAYVLYGLVLARKSGVDVDGGVLERASTFLLGTLVKAQDIDKIEEIYGQQDRTALAFRAYALAQFQQGGEKDVARGVLLRLADLLHRDRERLGAYGKALLCHLLADLGDERRAREVLENLADVAKVDAKAGTVAFGEADAYDWRHDGVEATSLALRAWLKLDAKSPLVPGMVRYLVDHRRGAQWRSTKATAHAVFGLSAYLRASGELDARYTLKLRVRTPKGELLKKEVPIDRKTALLADTTIVVPSEALVPGETVFSIEKAGSGNLYYAAFLSYYTLEEGIPPGASGFDVVREYLRVHEDKKEVERTEWIDGKAVVRKAIEVVERFEPIAPGATLESGDRIEVRLKVSSDRPHEYLVFEDPKPAGCEPVALVSGTPWGTFAENLELRDELVAFFASRLPKGTHELKYRLRAEIPGAFHVMPVRAYAMYAPEVRASSAEGRLSVVDRK